MANSKEFDRLTVSRELPVSSAPGLGAALANLADWASESPSRAYHLKAKPSGGVSVAQRQLRASLQEEANGACSVDGVSHWRRKRSHVPTTLPDRQDTSYLAPQPHATTHRLAARRDVDEHIEYTGIILRGPPQHSEDKTFTVRWDKEHHSTAIEAEASISRQQAYRYKVETKSTLSNGSVTVQWCDSKEDKTSLNEEMLHEFYTRPATRPSAASPQPRPTSVVAPLAGDARPAPSARDHPEHLGVSWASALPQHDVLKGGGQYELIRRLDGTTTAHDPHGRCMASLSTERVNMLWRWYLQTNPKPKVADFACEVSACAAFYSNKRLDLRNHWSTPPELAARLSLAVGAETERFSSPMNASASFRRHYSYRPGDAAFGFDFDAYSSRFRGSWYMNPEYDAEEPAHSMRWARESVRTDEAANLGVAIVPRYQRAAHTRLLDTPGVHVLATMSKGFRFVPQDAWKGGKDLSTGTKFAVDIVVFYNEMGRQQHGDCLNNYSGLAEYLRVNFHLDRQPSALPVLDRAGNYAPGEGGPEPVERMRGPPGFHKAPPEAPLAPIPWPIPPWPPAEAPPSWETSLRATRWGSHATAYTDGSKSTSTCAGAEVWWPRADDAGLVQRSPGPSGPRPGARAGHLARVPLRGRSKLATSGARCPARSNNRVN